MGFVPKKGTAVEEQHVRVTISGPVLAALILTGWLELQGAPQAQAADKAEVGGTIELLSETAEYWLDLPCSLVYDIAAAPDVRRGMIEHFGPPNARSNGVHIPTYLLRFVVGGPE